MSRTPARFKQADLTRAVKAARAAGLEVTRTEITKDGRIVLVHTSVADEPERASVAPVRNEWDDYFDAQGQE